MKVIVTGSRTFDNREAVFKALNHISPSLVIEGGAEGADKLAREWCALNKVPNKTYYANWNKFGSCAGPIRNKVMLTENEDAIVCWFPGGRGTENCKSLAKKLNMITVEGMTL